MQQELTLLGGVTRPMEIHPDTEVRCCKTKAQACRCSLVHSGYSQDTVAERMGVTGGYLSMLLSGKRRWSDDMQRKFMRITGSLAPLQWDAMQEGVDLYVDPVKQRLAQLEAERAALMQQRAA